MNTHRLNPIEAMFATLTGLPAEDTLACGNWARLRATPHCTRVARPFIISVDPMLLAVAAAKSTPLSTLGEDDDADEFGTPDWTHAR